VKKASRVLIIALMTVLPAIALAEPQEPCSAAGVQRDVEVSLVGHVEVSTLRIEWSSRSEGGDLSHYEVWKRGGAAGEQLAYISRSGVCARRSEYSAGVPYFAAAVYYLEIHVADGTIRAVPVRIR